jgi:hypothetical protein
MLPRMDGHASLLTATDIAKKSGGRTTPRAVVRAADRGELPCRRTEGGMWVFESPDADRWLKSFDSQLELSAQ